MPSITVTSTINEAQITVWKGTGVTVRGLVHGNQRELITQSSVTSISLSVYDTADTSVVAYGPFSIPLTNIFDTLQTDDPDLTDGYNFQHYIAAAAFPLAPKIYVAIYTFTPAGGGGDPHILKAKIITVNPLAPG